MTQTAEGVLSIPAQTVLFLGMSLTVISLGAVEITLNREADEPTHPVLSPAIKIGIGALLIPLVFVRELPIPVALGIALLALVVPAFYGAIVWYRPIR